MSNTPRSRPPTGLPPGLLPLSAQEEAVLRALARVMIVLNRALDADLTREQRMSASEYAVLMHLSEASGRRMRMSELAAACDMSLSGMTRLATKLESDGHLKRVRCVHDARGMEAVLTDSGLTRLEAAWPTHLASARRHIFDHLDGLDLGQLATALGCFATAVEPSPPEPAPGGRPVLG